MFNCFKKTSPAEDLLKRYKERFRIPFSKDEKDFFKNIFSTLPDEYNYLRAQNNADIIITKAINLFEPFGFDLAIDETNEQLFINNNLPSFFMIRGIFIKKLQSNMDFELEIGITNGVFNYYSLKCNIDKLDISRISVTHLYEKRFPNDPKKLFMDQIGKEKFKELEVKFDINNIYETEIEGKYYIVFSVNDEGNIYCVDKKNHFYFISHDPWSIERINM